MKDRPDIYRVFLLPLSMVFYLAFTSDLNRQPSDSFIFGLLSEAQIVADLSECTTGLASGEATPDGRPLLWKNRDVSNWRQEYHYVDHGGIPYIGLTYENDIAEYYAGINAAGFAIENSDIHNLYGRNAGRNGWGSDPDDGETMSLALSTCRTVDDFEDILDSLNEGGRTGDFNYGTFDAFGGAAMFECDGYEYTRYDAADEEDGFLIRANFAFSGSDTSGDDYTGGNHRHDRALMLWREAKEDNNLTPHFIFQQVVRDLTTRECNACPLPYDGYHDTGWSVWPYGHVPHQTAISRNRTRSVFVGQGVRSGERPDDAVIWAMSGSPLACIATPLWVRAGSVPEEYDTDGGSRLNRRARDIAEWVTEADFGVDTWRLTNPDDNGIYDFVFPLETYIYNKTQRFLNSPRFSYDRLEAFQNEVAQQAADSLDAWRPTYYVTEVLQAVYEDNNIILVWEEGDDDRFGGLSPRGYNVYRNSHPFREGDSGELAAFVEGTRFSDDNPPSSGAFYRVEVAF